MAKVIFTAWKNKSQLAEVRSEFYPSPSYDGPDMRSHACAVVCSIIAMSIEIRDTNMTVNYRWKLGNFVAMSRITLRRRPF